MSDKLDAPIGISLTAMHGIYNIESLPTGTADPVSRFAPVKLISGLRVMGLKQIVDQALRHRSVARAHESFGG